MTNSDNIDLLTESYTLKQMVYINSANHGYSEILLDKHLAMFGDNNAGKTASLAGTKLLLFPEVNFYKCSQKFKFVGKTGFYSMEQSYDFYFPNAKSFIVLEVENPEGYFCMILYKTSNFGYGRFFVPGTYADIRHLFWQEDSEVFSDNLGIKTISRYIKANKGIQTTSPREIAYLMYDSFKGDKRNKRFCIFPLKDARIESINAFKNIYQLAFDTNNTEKKSLPSAIATLLEMGRGRNEERLDANLTKLSDEHSQLIEKQNWLQVLANAKPYFKGVASEFELLNSELLSYSKEYKILENTLIQAKRDYLPKKKIADETLRKLTLQKDLLNKELIDLNDIILKSKQEIELLDEAHKKNQINLNKAKQYISSFDPLTINEIMDHLQKRHNELEGLLKEYRNEDGIKKSLKKNIKEKNKLINKMNQLDKLINNTESSILYQVNDKNSASVLLSLCENLSSVSAEISRDQIVKINEFARLFSVDGAGYLTFLDKTVLDTNYKEYDIDSEIARWKEEKNKAKRRTSEIEFNMQRQYEALKHDDVYKLMDQTEEELNTTRSNISIVSGTIDLETTIKTGKSKINKLKDKLANNEVNLQEMKAEFSKLTREENKIKSQCYNLNEQKQSFDQIDKYLTNSRLNCTPIDSNIKNTGDYTLSVDKAIALFGKSTECSKKNISFTNQLNSLLTKIKHPDIDSHKQYSNLYDFKQIVSILNHAYETLEYDLKQHTNEIRSHNQLVNNQLNELKEAKIFLNSFINEINSDLNRKHVSNLSEINLKLNINKQFESLLSTLEKHNIQDDSLLDSQFYVSLAKFVESYFNKKTRRLKMYDIIESIKYQYTLSETGEIDTKSQSGGTTSTITAFVLSVLLKRITPKYVSLRMPIIVDEISTLDFKNTDATIKQITDNGFSIFCATPSFSAFICQKVGRWVMIDRAIISQPMISKCNMNILPKHVEGFGEKAHEA